MIGLLDCIPGGIIKCRRDECFTMLEMNSGFLDLCGYSKDEIANIFHNHFIELLYPDDRTLLFNNVREIEYRLLCCDGIKWVIDKTNIINNQDGSQYYIGLLVDVTESRNTQERLRLSLERHQIIMDQTTDIIFEWNIALDTLIFSSNWEKKFGYKPLVIEVSKNIPEHGHIHPEDIPIFNTLIEDSRRGVTYSTAEFRIQNLNGDYFWCRVRATDQFNDAGKAIKTVGVITDVTKEHDVIIKLRNRAERDALTGLYNKIETQSIIATYLAQRPENEYCALLMIDIDNFKEVNDTYGHLYGDALLSELSTKMKKKVRDSDVIGRIGGDEFVAFLKAIPSEKLAMNKARELLEEFHSLPMELHGGAKQITCSVGVALCPTHARDFQWLYRCADTALYQSKSEGKDRVSLYSTLTSRAEYDGKSSLGAAIDSDHGMTEVTDDVVSYVFHILYSTDDLEEAVNLILEIIGKRFGVSRAYIFENSQDNLYSSNTFEWCNIGISAEKNNLQNLPYKLLGNFMEKFDENGIMYCHDIGQKFFDGVEILREQGIRSMLHCQIHENGQIKGYVGFDECTGTRFWTQEEIFVLTTTSKLLSVFLLKKRAQDRDKKNTRKLKLILDSLDAFVYAIDFDNYELLYVNEKCSSLISNACIGNHCYYALLGSDVPCKTCPMQIAIQNNAPATCEIYNNQYNLYLSAHAVPIDWDGRSACLVSSYDITQYKKSI